MLTHVLVGRQRVPRVRAGRLSCGRSRSRVASRSLPSHRLAPHHFLAKWTLPHASWRNFNQSARRLYFIWSSRGLVLEPWGSAAKWPLCADAGRPWSPRRSQFRRWGHPPLALIPADAASLLTLLESAYDAADAQVSAAIDNLARLRTASNAIIGAEGAAR